MTYFAIVKNIKYMKDDPCWMGQIYDMHGEWVVSMSNLNRHTFAADSYVWAFNRLLELGEKVPQVVILMQYSNHYTGDPISIPAN